MMVSWNVTRRCNLACAHCYLDAVRRSFLDELNATQAARLIAQIAALAPGAMLVLSGGEPLLRRDLVALVEQAAENGLAPVIGTNGTLLSERRARQLKHAGAAGAGISLDSATPAFHDRLRGKPGAWQAAISGVLAARFAGLPVSLQATVFMENRVELTAIAELAEWLGAIALNFFFLVCTGRGVERTDLSPAAYEETLAALVELRRQCPRLMIRARCAPHLRRLLGLHAGETHGDYAGWSSACLAGRSYLRITPEGDVTPCPYIPLALGNATRTPLEEIWRQHPVLARLRSELPGGKCADCDFRHSCGGCRARALAQHGDLMAADPSCAYVRPAGTAPEPAPRAAAGAAVPWDPAAQALLERIPAFVRAHVRARLEESAAQEGHARVTVELMRSRRPQALSGNG